MTQIKLYKTKTFYLNAIQLTENNAKEIVKLINGPVILNAKEPKGLLIDTENGLEKASPGDYLIIIDNKTIYPMTSKQFHQKYQEVSTQKPTQESNPTEELIQKIVIE